MPLPTGRWKSNVDGLEQDIQIQSTEGGVLRGSFGAFPITGFWDEASQTITFDVPTEAAETRSIVSFRGYLFRIPANAKPGVDVVATLTGFAHTTTTFFLPASSRRNVFGWFAQITEVV